MAKIEETSAEMHLTFEKRFIGNSALEATELLKIYHQYGRDLQVYLPVLFKTFYFHNVLSHIVLT